MATISFGFAHPPPEGVRRSSIHHPSLPYTPNSRMAGTHKNNKKAGKRSSEADDCGSPQCPCCRPGRVNDPRQIVGDCLPPPPPPSLLDTEEDMEDDDQDRMIPGILSDENPYTVVETLVQGWVHKKGTGTDWMGSRAWKLRWLVLAMAKVDGYKQTVPMLLIYWHPSAPVPSSVIMLDKTVLVAHDLEETGRWNAHRFVVRPISREAEARIFCCPLQGRDAWVFAMNQALLQYEKSKRIQSPIRRSKSMDDRAWFALPPPRQPPTPPTSPSLPRRRMSGIPRPRPPLLGESLLLEDVPIVDKE